jgi:hypothetical protein
MNGKEISQSSDLNLPPGAHAIILSSKGSYVQNCGKRTGESFLRARIRQDNVSVKCATTFPDTLWKESANQEVYLRLVQTVTRQRLSLQGEEKVYGSLFFIENIVTGISYVDMLINWLMPQLYEDSHDFIFQQDGVPAHFHLDVRHYLNANLPQRWIGRAAFAQMAPRSPDLTPCDLFLWDYVKDAVFVPPMPTDIDDLKRRITVSVCLWLLLPVTCCDECGKSRIIDLTLPHHTWGSHRVLVRCENNF